MNIFPLFCHSKTASIDPVRGKFHVSVLQSCSPNAVRGASAGEVDTKFFMVHGPSVDCRGPPISDHASTSCRFLSENRGCMIAHSYIGIPKRKNVSG